MAALPDWPADPVVDLSRLSAAQLEPVLVEEAHAWHNELTWDFGPSADLVRRFVNLQALSGCALLQADEVAGYAYYVCEDSKGLIGDLYVREAFRTREREHALLEAVLRSLRRTSGIRRVEAQLMMLRHAPDSGRAYPRSYYQADLA